MTYIRIHLTFIYEYSYYYCLSYLLTTDSGKMWDFYILVKPLYTCYFNFQSQMTEFEIGIS